MVGNGEIADYQHFLLFPQCFQRTSFSGSLRHDCVGKGYQAIVRICRLHELWLYIWDLCLFSFSHNVFKIIFLHGTSISKGKLRYFTELQIKGCTIISKLKISRSVYQILSCGYSESCRDNSNEYP